MKKLTALLISTALLFVSPSVFALNPSKCFVTGGGVTELGDVFAVNAMWMSDGSTRGSLSLRTPYGDVLISINGIDLLRCTSDGGPHAYPPEAPQHGRFRGTGEWNGEDGYEFMIYTEDRGEPTELDFFEIQVIDSDLNIIYYSASLVVEGNIQHHSDNEGHPEP